MELWSAKYKSSFVICLAYFVATAAYTIFQWNGGFDGYRFGFEYGNVAAALAEGKGFSNTFGEGTGPTAWCPPSYVLLQAAIFLVAGVKSLTSFWIIMAVQLVLMTSTLWMLIRLRYSDKLDPYKFLIAPIFFLYTISIVQKEFDDKSLTVWLSVLTIVAVIKVLDNQTHRYRYVLVLLAVLLPSSNISLFGGAVMLLVAAILLNFRKRTAPISSMFAILLLGIMLLTIAAWGIRNKMAMGKFIAFKSNLWFEVYMSNVTDYDGLIHQSNWLLYHPLSNSAALDFYTQKGELAFVEHYKTIAVPYLASRPASFFHKIVNRGVNAFIFISSSNDVETVGSGILNAHDSQRLEKNKFTVEDLWFCLELPEDTFKSTLLSLHLDNPEPIFADWKTKKEIMEKRLYTSFSARVTGFIFALVPSLALLLCLIVSPVRKQKVFLVSLYFFLLSTAPYVLFSHYFRYQNFQFGYFTIFIFMAVGYWVAIFFSTGKVLPATGEK